MKFKCAVLILILVFCSGSTASAKQGAPLTEKELMYLLEQQISSRGLADLVESYGVAFQADPEVLERLKNAGATQELLEIMKRKARTLDVDVVGAKAASAKTDTVPPAARQHLQLGQQKLKNFDYEGALEEFAEAENIRPQWDQVFEQRGLALAGLGRYSEAASEWNKYLARAPGDADKAAIQKRIAEWEGEADKVKKTRVLLAQGEQKLQGGDAKGAVRSFGDAVALRNSVGTLLALARARLQDGDYGGLAETARQAQKLDPESALAALYLADAELRQGRSAHTALDRGLKSNPNLAYGQALLAHELGQRADQAPGQRQTKGQSANSASAQERNRRGWVLWNGGNFQQAIEELQEAAETDLTNDGWQCDLAYARLALRDTTGAWAAAREAVRLNSESACGHHALALSLEKMGKRDQATREFESAKKLSSALGLTGLLRPPDAGR